MSLIDIGDFEHDGCDQFISSGDEGRVCGEFVFYLILASLFDEEHFVHLDPHCVPVFEDEGCVGANFQSAVFFTGEDFAAKFASCGLVFFD